MNKLALLSQTEFGERIAEEESTSLSQYFVETDNWRRLFSGSIDIVYGPKGSGKSALYTLLVDRTDELFDRNIVLLPAENPRGTPAFSHLDTDPPATEQEFIGLWKIYFLSLISSSIEEYTSSNSSAKKLNDILATEGLVKGNKTLAGILNSALAYVKRIFRPEAVETTIHVDPATQMPASFSGKIHFSEPNSQDRSVGALPIEELFELANEALAETGLKVWILLDRLDVAFSEHEELEQNALRALFRVYLDLAGFNHVEIKVFLRTDIWERITESGFREASHITKNLTISWNESSLLNLLIRRLCHNEPLVNTFKLDPAKILESLNYQKDIFFRFFPKQVDAGTNKPDTLRWMLSRTKDGTNINAPRELIHFLNSLRIEQVRRLEVGEAEPEEDILFSRPAFKSALPDVSTARLNQTLYAEHPSLKVYIEELRGLKTNYTIDSLSSIWKNTSSEAQEIANNLVRVGFFEQRGSNDSSGYWVPFLYRDSLELIQGSAEEN